MMARAWNRLRGNQSQDYTPLPTSEKEPLSPVKPREARWSRWSSLGFFICVAGALLALYGLVSSATASTKRSCDTVDDGYRCSPKVSHFWGQYSMWFPVPSKISVDPPKDCEVTFANVLSRHGGRDPTLGKTLEYGVLIGRIQNTSTQYPGEYAFLKSYVYDFGYDQLTQVGVQGMVYSGMHFYDRYKKLVKANKPFVRAGGQTRVVQSGQAWLRGIAASLDQPLAPVDVIIPEGDEYNNTLSHDTCPAFTGSPGTKAQHTWVHKFVPPIRKRVNSKLGTNLTSTEIIYLMDMCPFDTIHHVSAKISPFCHLFSTKEWHAYDYYQTLGKYYGYGVGNPLGATQGVGYVNELLARLTDTPVDDHTNTNSTLDSNPETFPLGRKVYADFSHDNDISGVLAALGLYNKTKPLSKKHIETTKETHGFSAAWTVPFGSRMYVEKLQCKHEEEESVRIIVNDRVHPLKFCGGDKHGRCKLSKFVKSQSFSRSGGLWNKCFA